MRTILLGFICVMLHLFLKLKPWIFFLVAFLENVLEFEGLMSTPQMEP